MAFAEKKLVLPDAATLALWRVAENGNVEELVALLSRAPDINARNEHGVTALMRAAQNGRARMVRALLEHGADANIKRNDKFTALALAAFFGHTEVVRTLMEHGADSKASTRGGTSPQMWATARTFNEVANQLEKPAAVPPAPIAKPLAVVRETRVAAAMAKAAPVDGVEAESAAAPVRKEPLVVRTLKDPPEIWDLVHEAPRGFDPRSAFVTRLQSMRAGFVFRAATALVLIGMCVVGVLVMRRVQARSERTNEPQPSVASKPVVSSQPSTSSQPSKISPANNTAPANETSAPVAVTTPIGVASETGAAAEPETKSVSLPVTGNSRSIVGRKFGSGSRWVSSHDVDRGATSIVTSEAVQPVVTPSEKPAPARVEATAKPKTDVPLSPQLITPAKSPATKAKVIQWP